MSYRVIVSSRARTELDQAVDWWEENRSRDQACRWYLGISDKIHQLGDFPHSHSLAEENNRFPLEIRQMMYGLSSHPTHRALFTVDENRKVVLVVSIRHVAQNLLTPDEFDPLA